MSNFKPRLLEEDCRSSEGKVEAEEEGFYSFRDEDSSSPHLTWSTYEDFDDSGHFTASPDGERTFSGSSRSHSPCPTSAHLILQMQHHDNHNGSPLPQSLQLTKPLISPRSIMTVKVPQNIASSVSSYRTSTITPSQSLEDNVLQHGTSANSLSQKTTEFLPCSLQQEIEAAATAAVPSSPIRQNGDAPLSRLHTPSTSTIRTNDESSEYLRSILENFNSLYMEKLRMIDDLVTEGNEEQKRLLMEKKTSMLENWAKDVCIQNMVLVHTVEELEREANRKVSALQQKITESTHLAKEHMTVIKKYEQQVKLLLKNHGDTEEKNLVLKINLEKLKSECRRVRDRMNLMLKDNESVITLVCRIRDMGVWDVNGLELQRSSFEQIFGLYPNLVGSEVQTVFTKQKAKQVKETEEHAVDLEKQLEHIQKSHKEAEANVFQKDKKIEELEIQIKNLSDKVQYCVQECNDYKKSLLETQERLLEATRKLAITPKSMSRPNTPAVSEMAELIRELRDVKSQLNTAVDEKQTAREESSYFKKELSERFKEMHDIQNVFQNLATEVVSSRAAFQQVQEKEVQLQSLKSQVQTYQSRCVDAEDTIRKKEQEIKQLQKQMNKLHKKSKKHSYLSSSNDGSVVTSKPTSTMISFYNSNLRNASSSSKIPIRKISKPSLCSHYIRANKTKTKNTPATKKISEEKELERKNNGDGDARWRPPWNTNFKKSMGILSIPASKLPVLSRSSMSKESHSQFSDFTTKLSLETSNQSTLLKKNRSKGKSKLYANILAEQQLSSDQISFSNKTEQTLGPNSTIASTQKDQMQHNHRPEKLPKIVNQGDTHTTAHVVSPNEGGLNGEKLPLVKESHWSQSKPMVKGPPTKLDNPILKNLIHNPLAHTPRLSALITAVVETSKQLLGDETDEAAVQKGYGNLKITAAHYRKPHKGDRHNKLSARRVKSSDKNAELNRCKAAPSRPNLPRKHYSTTVINSPENADDQVNIVYEAPPDVKAFLSGLPQESQEDIVSGWIANSASASNSNKRLRKPKTPLSGRRPSLKVMKHLATRRYLKPLSPKSKPSAEDIQQPLQSEMFELEDEWGKVFANLESNLKGNDKRRVDKSSGPTTVDESTEQPISNVSVTIEESAMEETSSVSSVNNDDETMQELLDRLAAEKREMEESFKKELYERDIEIKMQKVTIQHLQDAYVALKRGHPIPIPQSVTGNGIMINGSSNGHHNSVMESTLVDCFSSSHDLNTSTRPEFISSVDGCSCANCLNKRCISDLINRFDYFKLNLLSKLGSLKAESIALDIKATSLESGIKSVTELVHGGPQYKDRGDGRQFEKDVNLLRKIETVLGRQLEAKSTKGKIYVKLDKQQKENVIHSTSDIETHSESKKIEESYTNAEDNVENNQVEWEQTQQQIGIMRLLPSNRKERDHIAEGYFSPMMQKLERMKEAFCNNENIIFTQNEQLIDQRKLISKYEHFLENLSTLAGGILRTDQPVTDTSYKLEHLCECVKQVLIDNGLLCKKLEAFQQMLQAATRENALLNETIASLNDNIDSLSRQNDKLLHQFAKKGRGKRSKSPFTLSNLSTPRSNIWEVEKEASEVAAVDMRASGDFCTGEGKTFTCEEDPVTPTVALSPFPEQNEDVCFYSQSCYQCRKSESLAEEGVQVSSHIPKMEAMPDDEAVEYVENLRLMAKCLRELDKNSKGILASSLPLFNDPNFCLSSDNSACITKPIDTRGMGRPTTIE